MNELVRYGGDYLIRDLLDGRMSASSIRDFNDPFELHHRPGKRPNLREAQERQRDILKRNKTTIELTWVLRGVDAKNARRKLKKWQRKGRGRKGRFVSEMTPDLIEAQRERSFVRFDEALKVMCCSNASAPHSGEIPMWGYYAECHRGVRLHFRPSFYTQKGILPPQDIDYCDTPVEFGFPEMDQAGMREFIGKILKTKSTAWEHEAEVRLVIENGVMTRSPDSRGTMRWWLPIKPEDVSRIDLGTKFANQTLLDEALMKLPDVVFFRASKNPEGYLCDYTEIPR